MKDWRLGALHYFFQTIIAVYIIGYVLLYDKVRRPRRETVHSRTETSCAPGGALIRPSLPGVPADRDARGHRPGRHAAARGLR